MEPATLKSILKKTFKALENKTFNTSKDKTKMLLTGLTFQDLDVLGMDEPW